jgi:predicted type IV restriction endonuclease
LSAGNRDLFDCIGQVSYRDYQWKFVIFLGKERKGRLLDVVENRDGTFRYLIADGLPEKEKGTLADLDDRLLSLFKDRIAGAEA